MYIIIAPVERFPAAILSLTLSPPGKKATFGIALHGIRMELPKLQPSAIPYLCPKTSPVGLEFRMPLAGPWKHTTGS